MVGSGIAAMSDILIMRSENKGRVFKSEKGKKDEEFCDICITNAVCCYFMQ